jgi:hypothetical protein
VVLLRRKKRTSVIAVEWLSEDSVGTCGNAALYIAEHK